MSEVKDSPELVCAAMDAAAIKIAKMPEGWHPYLWNFDYENRLVATGCMTRVKTRGPNKGELLYMTKTDRKSVHVPPEAVEQEKVRLRLAQIAA